MVTGDQELQWAYLLCPTFELSNSEGKPLTNGYIELYIAGTRDKYYAASDFAGTLHPFQIPLDSLGSNIVLVSPDNAYDIYVYNRFGNLVMSRYNVVPTNGAAGGGSSSSNISIESGDGTVVVTESTDPETGIKTFDLSVPCVSGNPSFWTGRGAATMGVTISDTEYHKLDISNHSIRNRNDDITVVDGEFNLKKGVYFWNVTVQLDKYDGHDNTRQRVFIESGYNRGAYTMDMTHDETETISFSGITVADYDDTKQDIKIKSEGESPFKAVLYNVSIHKLNQNILGDNGTTYTAGDYIEITEDDVINVTGLTTPEDVEAMIDAAITALASGDIYTGGDYINITNHVISVTGLQPEGNYLTPEDLEGYATETYVDNSVSSFATHTEVYNATVTAIEVATGAIPDTEDVDFEELDITQFAQASSIPVVTGFATRDEVYEAVVTGVQLATAQIPDQLEAGNYIDIINNTINVTGLQPEGDYLTAEDLEGYATEEYVTTYVDNSVSSFVTEEQVTAMFPETEDVTFKELDITQFAMASAIPVVTGFATHTEVYEAVVTGVQLATSMIPDLEGYATEEYVTTYVDNSVSSFTTNTEVYEATVTAIEAATAAIPDSEEVEFEEINLEEINLEDYALASAIPVVTGFATHTEVHEATVTAVQLATAQIPDQLEAGDYISIENNTINVTGLQPEGDYATHTEVHEATVTAIEHVTALIPEAQVQSDWTEADTADPSYIQHKPQEVRLVAGDNINITETATSVVISASGGGPEYTAGSNIEINNDAISLKDVVHIDSRNEAPEGYLLLGNIVHWGNDDYGPGIMVSATMDDYMDNRLYVWYNTSDQGREDRFWGQYDYDRETMAVSGESYLGIYEGDIRYQRGDFDRTDRLPVIWSCSGMRYDIDRLQESVTAIPTIELNNSDQVTAIDGHTLAVSGVDSNIFWAIYGTTTYDEVKAAHTAGKKIVMYDGDGNVVGLTQHDGTGGATERFYFCWVQKVWQPGGPTLKYAYICKRDGWYRSYTDIQADWNVTNNYYPGYIKNKPSIPVVELNSSDQVTAIDGHTLAGGGGGSTYTAGDYISIENDEISVTGVGNLVAGNNITITESGDNITISAQGGGSTYTAGKYISIDSNDVIAVTGLAPVSGSDGIAVNNNVVSLDTPVEIVAGDNITISVTGASAIISAQGGGGGGTTYTAGQYISIDANNEISVTGLQVAGSYATTSDISDMATKTWVGNQGYLTSIPSTYATDIEVSNAVVTGVQTATGWVNSKGYLTSIPSTYATDSEVATAKVEAVQAATGWVNSQGYAVPNVTRYTAYDLGAVLYNGTGVTIGNTSAKIKLNLSNILTSYTVSNWSVSSTRLTSVPEVWEVKVSAVLKDVIGTQWAYKSNAVSVTAGHISDGPHCFPCWMEWASSPTIEIVTTNDWTQQFDAILRDVRNSTTADNNYHHINFTIHWFNL